MLKSGMPISAALMTQMHATDNSVFKEYITKMQDDVEKGRSLEQILSTRDFKLIPGIMGKMIGVGEKTGNLDESFTYLGEFFEEETEDMINTLSTLLEPIILLVVGGVVAFLAFAIIIPIYQFSGSIK
jgi:type IV pilus assembly protein PilC